MLKYCGHYITFQEVPNEVSLTFTITNCPYRCEGCHSPWLQSDIGDELTIADILDYINQYQGAITCVCFMGTGGDIIALGKLINYVHKLGLKVCIYTGKSCDEAWNMVEFFLNHEVYVPDYVKYGMYIKELGGLNSKTTNQRMMMRTNDSWENITPLFWKKKE